MKKSTVFITLLTIFILTIFIGCNKEELYPIQKDSLYGYIDSLGNEVIKPQYLYASGFNDGLALVVVDTTIKITNSQDTLIIYKYGYINSSNKVIIDTTMEFSEKFTDNVKASFANGELDFSDFLFYEGLAFFVDSKTNKYGYIDKKGKVTIKPNFLYADRFSEGLADVKISKSGKNIYGYIDKTGNFVIPAKYSNAQRFTEGLALVLMSDYGWKKKTVIFSSDCMIINKEGKMVGQLINNLFFHPYPYSDGFSVVEHSFFAFKMGYKFMDRQGKFTTDFDLENVTRYGNGYAGVKVKDGWVFVDKKLNISSKPYQNVLPFKDGLAAVKENGKWGYIDTTFQTVISNQFDTCGFFIGKLAMFQINSSPLQIKGYINKKGDIVWQNESYKY